MLSILNIYKLSISLHLAKLSISYLSANKLDDQHKEIKREVLNEIKRKLMLKVPSLCAQNEMCHYLNSLSPLTNNHTNHVYLLASK